MGGDDGVGLPVATIRVMTSSGGGTPDEWAGDRAARWVRNADSLVSQMAPVAELLLDAAGLRPGERVLDVGCGTGPTTVAAAAAVGPTGAVTGIDVAAEMLAAARRGRSVDGAPIDWVEADASTWRSPGDPFDVVLSRFGVMFFRDPPAAFANLCRLTSPGGRLQVAVWAHRSRSPLFEVPLGVACELCRAWRLAPEVPDAGEGPFSLGEAGRVVPLLEAAGWRDVTVEPRPLALRVGGGMGPDEAARASLEFGPTRVVVETLPGERRSAVAEAIAAEYRGHVDGRGHVVLEATPVLIAARRPA